MKRLGIRPTYPRDVLGSGLLQEWHPYLERLLTLYNVIRNTEIFFGNVLEKGFGKGATRA